jgi:hypothetical protein
MVLSIFSHEFFCACVCVCVSDIDHPLRIFVGTDFSLLFVTVIGVCLLEDQETRGRGVCDKAILLSVCVACGVYRMWHVLWQHMFECAVLFPWRMNYG